MYAFLGIFVFIALAWLFSSHAKAVSWRLVITGVILQFIFAVMVLGIPAFNMPGLLSPLFKLANQAINAIIGYSNAGTEFVFGPLANATNIGGFVFAVQVLPIIIFFSSLMAVLYHLGIMQVIVKGLALVVNKVMGISGPESLAAAANVFVGQTEAPLIVKPYLQSMSRSELMSLMSGGMATVSGSVMAAYVGLLNERIPEIGGHLLTASIMSAPAAILFAKIMVPETKESSMKTVPKLKDEDSYANVIDAATVGASDGLKLALNVAAMLIAFIALVALVNGFLEFVSTSLGFGVSGDPLSLEYIFGVIFTPFAFLMGIPWQESLLVGQMLGEKVILNEFVAFVTLSNSTVQLSDRAIIITSYALCGFANISSIGIQIGGIGVLIPERRQELSRLGGRAVVAGSFAAFSTACVVALLL